MYQDAIIAISMYAYLFLVLISIVLLNNLVKCTYIDIDIIYVYTYLRFELIN